MGYGSAWATKEQEIKDIVSQVAAEYPNNFAIAGKRNEDGSEVEGNDRFIRKAAIAVAAKFVDCGLNGKRGDIHNISRDVLAFPNPAGCRDASGRYLGLELRDVIGGAGGSNPTVTFTDVTVPTMESNNPGAWVKPELSPGSSGDSGNSGSGGGAPGGPPVLQFPPRDEELGALEAFNQSYKDAKRKKNTSLWIDNEGIAVWFGEYLRRRLLGESHAHAILAVQTDMYAAGLEKPEE